MRHRKAKHPKRRQLQMQVGLDRRVFSYISAELLKNLQVEEGGKYVGHLLAASDSRLHGLGFEPNAPAMLITDFLPSGPNATRTAVELQPDGEYQERLFRELERMDHEIEHVGTWHSHHCNGLQTLSSGDVEGYLRTVNRAEYRPDNFLASLVTRLPRDPSDQDWIDHYLFVRGSDNYYKINQLIKIIDWPTKFGTITGHLVDFGMQRIPQPPDDSAPSVRGPISDAWYEKEEGRKTLVEDKHFFSERFKGDLTATRRGQCITLTGRIGRAAISINYPSDPAVSQISIFVRSDDAVLLEIKSELHCRRLAMTAALAAANKLM